MDKVFAGIGLLVMGFLVLALLAALSPIVIVLGVIVYVLFGAFVALFTGMTLPGL